MSIAGVRKYTRSRLIICEGSVDVAFLKTFVRERRLRQCQIRHSGEGRYSRGGKSKFSDALKAAQLNQSFRRTVKEVVIIVDSDDDHNGSFEEVSSQINLAGFQAPPQPRVWSNGTPKFAIFPLPPNDVGALECYIQSASRVIDPNMAAFVDYFVDHVAIGWPATLRAKLWFRTFISVRNRTDPSASSWAIVEKNDPEVVLTTDATLNGLAAFLS